LDRLHLRFQPRPAGADLLHIRLFVNAELSPRLPFLWLYWSFFVILLGAEINGETIKAFQGETLQGGRNAPEKINDKPAADSDIAA
jgi:hypothetical protein